MRTFIQLVLAALLLPATSIHVAAKPSAIKDLILVNLRIEGTNKTIYEGPILARPENVTTASGGTHACNGLNHGANATPGATCTTALDAAAKTFGFTFDGTYDGQFEDFFITCIGSSVQTATQFWGLLLDYQFTPGGGCQQEVAAGQHVLWAFDAFNKSYFLKLVLTGAPRPVVGGGATFTVTDGTTGVIISGATVSDGKETATTASDGTVTIKFTSPGIKTFKASRDDSLRSNGVPITVL